jgi:hypothetical protein
MMGVLPEPVGAINLQRELSIKHWTASSCHANSPEKSIDFFVFLDFSVSMGAVLLPRFPKTALTNLENPI